MLKTSAGLPVLIAVNFYGKAVRSWGSILPPTVVPEEIMRIWKGQGMPL